MIVCFCLFYQGNILGFEVASQNFQHNFRKNVLFLFLFNAFNKYSII